jgi:hypothetical protein
MTKVILFVAMLLIVPAHAWGETDHSDRLKATWLNGCPWLSPPFTPAEIEEINRITPTRLCRRESLRAAFKHGSTCMA